MRKKNNYGGDGPFYRYPTDSFRRIFHSSSCHGRLSTLHRASSDNIAICQVPYRSRIAVMRILMKGSLKTSCLQGCKYNTGPAILPSDSLIQGALPGLALSAVSLSPLQRSHAMESTIGWSLQAKFLKLQYQTRMPNPAILRGGASSRVGMLETTSLCRYDIGYPQSWNRHSSASNSTSRSKAGALLRMQ
jgi:hypothetical protein